MAVPDSINIRNLTGSYVMNKELSGDPDAVLVLQGIGWIVRQAVKYAHVVIHIKQYDNEEGVNRIDIEQVSTGGFKNTEERAADWVMRGKKDHIFGEVQGKARFCKVEDIKDDFLTADLDPKELEASKGEIYNAYTESVGLDGDQWTADQVWGFEVIDGKRRHIRRIIVKRGDQEIKIKSVYDWKEDQA